MAAGRSGKRPAWERWPDTWACHRNLSLLGPGSFTEEELVCWALSFLTFHAVGQFTALSLWDLGGGDYV